MKPIFPKSADLQAVTAPKPIAPPEIVLSDKADEEYRAKHDSWAESVSRAGGRICRWVVNNGGTLPFDCPKGPE